MGYYAQSWLAGARRFSLLAFLSLSIIVQFAHMAAASQNFMQEHLSNCDHVMSIDMEHHMSSTESGSGHHGMNAEDCSMVACSGFMEFQAGRPSSMHVLLLAEYTISDSAKSEGPILSQIGKPPKHS